MKADPKVIADLQTTCGLLATLVEQLRWDCQSLKNIDCDWLASKCSKWYDKAEGHLEILECDLISFGAQPGFSIGKPSGAASVEDIVNRNLATAQSMFDQLCAFRTRAMNIRADDIPDDYEHAIQFLKKMIVKLEAQQQLVSGLTLPGYIGARLEDG